MLASSMRNTRAFFLAATVATVLACGGAPPAQHATTLPTATATIQPAPPVDLSAVAMPRNAVAVIRVAHPAASADVLSAWAGQALDPLGPIAELVGSRIAKVADLDGPMDMLVLAKDRGGERKPDFVFAVALGVKNFEAAKAALESDYGLLPIRNGAFEIQRGDTGGQRREGDRDFRVCALGRSTGGGRIVCSRNATSRDDALPYLTRGTASLASVKSDFHVEARPGPFADLVRRERSSVLQSGRFGGSGQMDAVWQAMLSDFIDAFLDLRKGTLDASIDGKHGTADLTLTTRHARALVTRLLTSHPERAEPPPASFLRLPGDADVALFEHGIDADAVAAPKAALLDAIRSSIEHEGKVTSAADRASILDVLGRTIDVAAMPIVYARGVDYAKAIPATSGLTEGSDARKIVAGVEQAAGWDVFGVDGKPEKMIALFKDWASLFARPSIKKTMDRDAPTFRVVATPRGAPKGTLALAVRVTHPDFDWGAPPPRPPHHGKASKPKKRPPFALTLHTLVVPDKTTAWVVSALDAATALAEARAIVSGKGSTLASRAGLESLRSAHVNFGGFFTPRGLGMGLPLTWLVGNPRREATRDPLIGISSPSQYVTPLVFTAAERAAGPERSLTVSMDVPRAALADFLAVGPRIFH
jgi:hypothetical protein